MSRTLTSPSEEDHLSLTTSTEDQPRDEQPPRQLPVEIYQAIMDHLPRKDLKKSRLVNKTFAQLSNPRLFSKLVLLPSVQHLDQLVHVFDTSDIQLLVREVIYDDRWLAILKRLKAPPADPNESEQAKKSKSRLSDLVEWLGLSYLNTKDDKILEIAALGRVLSRLPNCESIIVIDESQETKESKETKIRPEDVPYFIQQSLSLTSEDFAGMARYRRSSTSGTRLQAVLVSLYGSRLLPKTIRASNLSWISLFGDHAAAKELWACKPSMALVKTLDLEFVGSNRSVLDLVSDADLKTRMERLQYLLHSLTDLQSLRLKLHGISATTHNDIFYKSDTRSDMLRVFGPCEKQLFKHIHTLNLESFNVSEMEIKRLMRLHASSLRHLTLRNISLIRKTYSGPKGCWVRIIKALRVHLNLESMTFGGCLSNGGRQLWYISSPPSGPINDLCLRNRIERFVTHRTATCPSELLAVGIKPGLGDVEAPSETHPWVKGDCSWSMTQRYAPSDEITFIDEDLSDDGYTLSPAQTAHIYLPPMPSSTIYVPQPVYTGPHPASAIYNPATQTTTYTTGTDTNPPTVPPPLPPGYSMYTPNIFHYYAALDPLTGAPKQMKPLSIFWNSVVTDSNVGQLYPPAQIQAAADALASNKHSVIVHNEALVGAMQLQLADVLSSEDDDEEEEDDHDDDDESESRNDGEEDRDGDDVGAGDEAYLIDLAAEAKQFNDMYAQQHHMYTKQAVKQLIGAGVGSSSVIS